MVFLDGMFWGSSQTKPQEVALDVYRPIVDCNSFWNFLRYTELVPSGQLTWQWKMDLLKMYSVLKMCMFHCHVSYLFYWRVSPGSPTYLPSKYQKPGNLLHTLVCQHMVLGLKTRWPRRWGNFLGLMWLAESSKCLAKKTTLELGFSWPHRSCFFLLSFWSLTPETFRSHTLQK